MEALVLKRYSVSGLFGSANVKSFSLDRSFPTILTGSNGSGKSTVLRSISSVGALDLGRLFSMPFEQLTFEFAENISLEIVRTEDELEFRQGANHWTLPRAIYYENHRRAMKEVEEAPAYRRSLAQSGVRRKVIREMLEDNSGGWLKELLERFSVLLIEDQRLMISKRTGRYAALPPRAAGPQVAAVNEFARELRDLIERTQKQYATVSQELDEGFYHKVIEALDRPVELDELRRLRQSVTEAAGRLRSVGLLGEERELATDPERLEAEAVRPVIKTFAEDTLQKYNVLMPLQEQLEVFVAFLDKHYRDKHVAVVQDRGFVIELGDGQFLMPSHLSSGEQQILTLAYQLVFKSRAATLVLIDEPELSLHVNWQQSLIDDLNNLGQQQELSFLLATHSPTVIGDRPELVRSLDK